MTNPARTATADQLMSPKGWGANDAQLFERVVLHVGDRIAQGELPSAAGGDSTDGSLLGLLHRHLLKHRAIPDLAHARLASVLASACMGGHHLWQDLGLNGREQVSRLMCLGFPALFDSNVHNLRWKRHLFEDLGSDLGQPGLRPPKCDQCDDFSTCMGSMPQVEVVRIHQPIRERSNMKASARNRFEGSVAAVRDGSINDEIELVSPSGVRIVATVTRSSRVDLGLQAGAKAFALVKASSVVLVTDTDGVRFSTRNQLRGKIVTVATGAVNTEVVLTLPGGEAVAAIITNESAESMDLQPGMDATAIFKASSVIIGVQA